jgi:hypothetical protein
MKTKGRNAEIPQISLRPFERAVPGLISPACSPSPMKALPA